MTNHTRSPWALIGIAVVVGLWVPASLAQSTDGPPAFVPGEVIIQFEAGAPAQARAAARTRARASRAHLFRTGTNRFDRAGDLELARLPPGVAVADAIRSLQADSAVAFAEPNWIYTHELAASDPYYTNGSLWGMYGDSTRPANQFGSQAGEAWAAGHVGSHTVYVGIVDEGVMSHADFGTNIWSNPGEVAGNDRDDDRNGYVDDVRGWDFAGNNNTTYDGMADDHGTHVAGTIGAVGGNSMGVAGMNWNVTMIPAKFLGSTGGTLANAIRALDYLTDLKTRYGINLVATNNSWGGGGYSQALLDAINRGGNAGILFIAAAGNGGSDLVGDNNDTRASYPSVYKCDNSGTRGWDCLIAVAAITSAGAKSSFSNYGATTVDLGAPGSSIFSTLPGSRNYGSYSGTSMATPHVTGAAALYASTRPWATARDIKAAILSSTVRTASLAGRSVTGGRLNVSRF